MPLKAYHLQLSFKGTRLQTLAQELWIKYAADLHYGLTGPL